MQTITLKFDFSKYTIEHFLDVQSGNLERIVLAAHSLAEGGILHYPASTLKPILEEFLRQCQAYAIANSGNSTAEQIRGMWDQALRGPMNDK